MVTGLLDTIQHAREVIAVAVLILILVILFMTFAVVVVLTIELSLKVDRFNGSFAVMCPIECRSANVRLQALRAGLTSIGSSNPDLRISNCSVWPTGNKKCHQQCIKACKLLSAVRPDCPVT